VEEVDEVHVVGAGPAGAALAYFAGLKGYRVIVHDVAPAPGLKPCGGLVPRQVEEYLRIPDEVKLNEVRGFRVYLDGELLWEKHGGLWGWLINKPLLLKTLLSAAEQVRYKSYVRVRESGPAVLRDGTRIPEGSVVVAAGPLWAGAPADKIMAVQCIVESGEDFEAPDTIELWFDSSLTGYYWFFPVSERVARVGVGGYASVDELIERLRGFMERHPGLGGRGGYRVVEPIRGSSLVVAGPSRRLLEAPNPVIGEAAGLVYPISGEGIRPAIASAKAVVEKWETGRSPWKTLSGMVTWMRRQRRLLDMVAKASPSARAAVLRSLPLEASMGIALGEASTSMLLRIALKAPGAVARVIKAMLSE